MLPNYASWGCIKVYQRGMTTYFKIGKTLRNFLEGIRTISYQGVGGERWYAT